MPDVLLITPQGPPLQSQLLLLLDILTVLPPTHLPLNVGGLKKETAEADCTAIMTYGAGGTKTDYRGRAHFRSERLRIP